MEKLLITGATGCTGLGVLRYFSYRNGYELYGLVRKIPTQPLDGVTYVTGDFTDYSSLLEALKGKDIDTVLHIGGAIRQKTKNKDFYRVNVDGTNNLLKACKNANVKNFLFVSTTSVYGTKLEFPVKEEHKTKSIGHYSKSKLAAEFLVQIYCEENGLNAVILRPPIISGRYDRHFYPIVKNLVKRNIFPIIGKAEHLVAFAHPYDIAQAVELTLMEKTTKVETYNVVSFNITIKDFIRRLEKKLVGKNRFKIHIPYLIAYLGAFLIELIGFVTFPKREPFFNREYAVMIGKDWIFETSKLEALGYKPIITIEQIIDDIMKEEPLIPPKTEYLGEFEEVAERYRTKELQVIREE